MDRAICVAICLVWKMRSLAAGMRVGVRSMPTGSFGQGGLMLQDLKPPVNPKETSVMTHPDSSMKMYDISISSASNTILPTFTSDIECQPIQRSIYASVSDTIWSDCYQW